MHRHRLPSRAVEKQHQLSSASDAKCQPQQQRLFTTRLALVVVLGVIAVALSLSSSSSPSSIGGGVQATCTLVLICSTFGSTPLTICEMGRHEKFAPNTRH
jgi:hypothetical protein